MDLKENEIGEPGGHWYYIHKSKVVMKSITRYATKFSPLIDIGSGSGFFAKQVLRKLGPKEIFCIDTNYNDGETGYRDGINFQIEPPKLRGNLYLLIDVLEHVEDAKGLLKSYVLSSNPSAIFIVSVPAFMSLWSPHDVFLNHVKRYTLPELRDLVSSCNLEIIEARYLFAPIFPLVFLYRKLFRNRAPSSDLTAGASLSNSIIEKILWLDLYLTKNRVFGTSAFIVAKAPSGLELEP